jgi:heme exporter protein B
MSTLALLLKKDLLLEFRNRETIALIFCLALLLAVLASFGVHSAFLDPETTRAIFPMILWMVFIFAATVSIGRSFEFELENSAIEGLILTRVPSQLIFISKFLGAFIILAIAFGFCLISLALLLNVSVTAELAAIGLVSIEALLAYAALSTLVSALAGTARLKSLLLPLLLLPLVIPIFIGALELTSVAFEQPAQFYSSPWLSLLAGIDLIYFVAGLLLYGYALND